jgi:hypothetical protein
MDQARPGVAVTGLNLEPEPVWVGPDPVRLCRWSALLTLDAEKAGHRRVLEKQALD